MGAEAKPSGPDEMSSALGEVARFLRVALAAWRQQHRMSFLDAYDLVERELDEAGKRQFRAALVTGLDGLVVEIGAGTGLMLPHYRRGIRMVATEPGRAALRLLEHVRSDRPVGGLLMDVFNPVWRALNGAGCNLNRDIEAALPAAGFTVVTVRGLQLLSSTFPAAYPYKWISAVRR